MIGYTFISEEFDDIIRNCYDSLPNRMDLILLKNGNPINYWKIFKKKKRSRFFFCVLWKFCIEKNSNFKNFKKIMKI